ncbi:hypothetical protein [Actinoplanes utahensis]|uniref:hypothetical protein n=1 Tax=Actinoplanes utahensis TaxID=1869 RepID=UPI00068A981B|nr:hypothetical protein [Actinoplanes utahensis]GIF29939.1 hypothetical protein Aut01nite_29250 [Actinoplanes utahensis]
MSDHTTDHGSLLMLGTGPIYLSRLPAADGPDDLQFLLEAALPQVTVDAMGIDRARWGDGPYTFDPDPAVDLEPVDGLPARTTVTGAIVRGHTGRGDPPMAKGVEMRLRRVVWFRRLDGRPGPAAPLSYLCFGHGDRVYLAHRRPGFDQVLEVRFVPGTVRTAMGHPLADDVAELRFGEAQPVEFARDDAFGRRLRPGEVATAAFPETRSPSHARGFTVRLEIERELHLGLGPSCRAVSSTG